jgi:hypothetical protein
MKPLVAKYEGRAQSTVTDFNNLIATNINASMYNQSAFYANAVNTRVDDIQTTINNGVFGWVNITTTTLNNTINEFYTDVQNAVSLVFGGTILEAPAQEFVKCFIGGKVDAIEHAITFLHDNLHVDMPRVNDTVLVLSPASVDEATRPIAAAAIGDGTDGNQGFVGKVIQAYEVSLKKERVMFGVFMALWGVVVLMGLAVVLWHSFGKSYLEKKKKKKYEKEQRTGFENFSNSKEMKLDVLSPSKRTSFKPSWLSTKPSSQTGSSSPSSQESSASDRPWETAFAKPTPQPVRTRASKLLAVGRKAFSREPRLKKDGGEEEIQRPVQDNEPAIDRQDDAWYDKMAGKKNDEGELVSDDQDVSPKPKLHVFTQRAIGEQESPRRESGGDLPTRSRFSTSPAATHTSWKHLISPPMRLKQLPPPPPLPAPTVVGTHEPQTPLSPSSKNSRSPYGSYPLPPIGLPIKKPNQSAINVTSATSAQSTTAVPIPLHSGFDSRQYQTPLTPRPPSQHTRYPTLKGLPERHRKSVSLGSPEPSTPRWRVTNAVPGDSVSNSSHSSSSSAHGASAKNGSSNPFSTGDEAAYNHVPVTPMARFLARTDGRQSSLNPFITPFDDEHRVRIDGPSPEGLRKSMQTGALAY